MSLNNLRGNGYSKLFLFDILLWLTCLHLALVSLNAAPLSCYLEADGYFLGTSYKYGESLLVINTYKQLDMIDGGVVVFCGFARMPLTNQQSTICRFRSWATGTLVPPGARCTWRWTSSSAPLPSSTSALSASTATGP